LPSRQSHPAILGQNGAVTWKRASLLFFACVAAVVSAVLGWVWLDGVTGPCGGYIGAVGESDPPVYFCSEGLVLGERVYLAALGPFLIGVAVSATLFLSARCVHATALGRVPRPAP
jgi:hypothetical protein